MLDEHTISSQVVLNLVLNYSSQVVIKINNRRYINNIEIELGNDQVLVVCIDATKLFNIATRSLTPTSSTRMGL